MTSLLISAVSEIVARKTRIQSLKDCTPDICSINSSYYYYRVSLAALIAFLGTYAFTRRGFAFTLAMVSGVALEVVGYVGRILSWKNQWLENGFLMQIVCLTIAPAFMAGGIYLCLRRIVYAFGPENSRIKPESYTRIVRTPRIKYLDDMKLTQAKVYPLRSSLLTTTGCRWWNGLCCLALEQVAKDRRRYHGGRPFLPSVHTLHLHGPLCRLWPPHP